MKIKCLVAILLTLILCLSCFLVSCTPKNKEPEVNSDPESDKKVISDILSDGSIGDIFEKLESEETSIDLSAFYEKIAEISFSSDLDVNTQWLDSSLFLSMNDGIIEAKLPERSTYVVIDEDFSVTTLSGYPYSEGYWITSEEMIPSDIEIPSDNQSFEDALGLSEEALELIKDFSFPEIDEDDIELDDDWYIIPDEYYEDIAKSVLDLIVEVSEIEGEETPTEEEFDEALDMVVDLVEALGLEIGFAVVGDNVTGIKVSLDVDTQKLSEIDGGNTATPYSFPEEEDSHVNEKLKADIEIWLTDDATLLSSVKISLDIETEPVSIDGYMSYKYSYKDNMPSGVSLKADMEIEGVEEDVITIKGELSTDLIFDKNEVCGLSVDVDMDMKNISIGEDYYTRNDGGYEYVTCIGDVNADASFIIDLSKIDDIGEEVISADIDCEVKATSLYYEEYPEPTYNEQYDMWEHGDPVKSSDMSVFEDAPELSDFSSIIDIYGYATVESEKLIDIYFIVAMDEDVTANISGKLDLDYRKNISLPDGLDADTLVEDYERISLRAEEVAYEIEYDYSSELHDGYYIYDAESGLYAYISMFGYVENIGTVTPDNDDFIDDCGVHIEYTK